MAFLYRLTRSLPSTTRAIPSFTICHFTTTPSPFIKVDSSFISRITAAEKTLTNSDEPTKGGPTAKAQAHVGQELTREVVSDITAGEKVITNSDEPVQGGPTSVAQSALTESNASGISNASSQTQNNNQNQNQNQNRSQTQSAEHNGKLDSATLSKITDAEKQLTGKDGPVPGGPTAKAQKHANEKITSEVLSEITEGEKKVTGGERVKGGPTSKFTIVVASREIC